MLHPAFRVEEHQCIALSAQNTSNAVLLPALQYVRYSYDFHQKQLCNESPPGATTASACMNTACQWQRRTTECWSTGEDMLEDSDSPSEPHSSPGPASAQHSSGRLPSESTSLSRSSQADSSDDDDMYGSSVASSSAGDLTLLPTNVVMHCCGLVQTTGAKSGK